MVRPDSSRNVNAKEAIDLIRGSISNTELMEKFKISPKGFADLLRQLFEKKLISEEDLNRRGIRYKILKKEEDAAPQLITVPAPPAAKPLSAVEHPEDFLDTVELTALLSSFNNSPTPAKKKEPPPPVVEEPATKEEVAEKKAKFSISGLFKKKR